MNLCLISSAQMAEGYRSSGQVFTSLERGSAGEDELGLKLEKRVIQAIKFTAQSRSVDFKQAEKLLVNNDLKCHATFRYGLAKKVSKDLGMMSSKIEEIYLHGSSTQLNASINSDIDMIISLTEKPHGASFFFAYFNLLLTRSYKKIMYPQAEKMHRLLDIQLVNRENPVQRNKRYPHYNSLSIYRR